MPDPHHVRSPHQAAVPRGLAARSIRHPVGVVMLTLAVVVLGVFAYIRLAVDLLPHIIYPEVRVRVIDPGVPAQVMEDRVTRQLEEQLAITEDVVSINSATSEGRSAVDLSFRYGTDIDRALNDASTRLDRAKRFLPETIDPPIIYKRDPSQWPVAEFIISSRLRHPVQLRAWVDYVFARRLLNLPGVASVEVGGGLVREIQVLLDQGRLAGVGLTAQDIVEALRQANVDQPGGRAKLARREIASRTAARFTTVADIKRLPLVLPDQSLLRLGDLATVVDGHAEETLRVRLNGVPGVKVSIQKQPNANTVEVVQAVQNRLSQLRKQNLIPQDVDVHKVGDESIYIRNALRDAGLAALSGAILAMLVVYLFLGDLRRTLIVGSAIPIAITVAFLLMDVGGLTLNVMTLGGLAVGVGMLVDNTIVMLENIQRHQSQGEDGYAAGEHAAAEVNSAIIASTSTNLAALLPFLFVAGLIGLLFRELILTISAAIVASLVVALTLVPALAARVPYTPPSRLHAMMGGGLRRLQNAYAGCVAALLNRRYWRWLVVAALGTGLYLSLPAFQGKRIFLPNMDNGIVAVRITLDPGTKLEETDRLSKQMETLLSAQPRVASVFTTAGGFVFGRSEYESHNKASFTVQLQPTAGGVMATERWIRDLRKAVRQAQLPGAKVRIRARGIRGVLSQSGSDDVSLRITGPDLTTLESLGMELAERLRTVEGLRNISYSAEERRQELTITIDRDRAASLGLDPQRIGDAIRLAVDGEIATEFIQNDRSHDIRVRLPEYKTDEVAELGSLLVAWTVDARAPIYLSDVARIETRQSSDRILRDSQQRMVEVAATLADPGRQEQIEADIADLLADFPRPPDYGITIGGLSELLIEGQNTARWMLVLALFMVFVVMAVQYESLRNPLAILLSVPFAAIGVGIGLVMSGLPLSMPVWLGMIMLAGIVVNNAIVLVEYIELQRRDGAALGAAIVGAARLRLRPILMTTLTTMIGLSPLALGLGQGAEMLQPLAVTIVFGLGFSMLVSLFLVPMVYAILHRHRPAADGIEQNRGPKKTTP